MQSLPHWLNFFFFFFFVGGGQNLVEVGGGDFAQNVTP